MLHIKTLRLISLCQRTKSSVVNESTRDTALDMINYATFLVEWLDGILPGQTSVKED